MVPSSVPSTRFKLYKHFKIEPLVNKITVKVGEPDLLNPNSFSNISKNLYNLSKRASISNVDGCRKWLILECDGGIMYVLLKLLYNVIQCNKCKEVMYGVNNFEEHICKRLHDALWCYKFDWIIPQNGLLHLEMNSGKAFMSCNWQVFMEAISEELGFKFENAKKYIKKGSDHHKLWSILEITYLAMTDELLLPYAKACKKQGLTPTTQGYWKYSEGVVDPNYDYVQQTTFTYLHAMMLLRRGIRFCDATAILAAKSKLVLLFFGRNHLRYQFLLTHRMFSSR